MRVERDQESETASRGFGMEREVRAAALRALRDARHRVGGRGERGDRSDRGFSVLETLVAVLLTLVLMLGALGTLHAMRGSYIKSELAGDAMQRVRIAMESLSHDLRLAGLGVDPDGSPGRRDEAIEGAWPGAIAARGDLDADDRLDREDPERWIAGAFPSTRIGNDEVFAYALRRETGSGGTDLVFEADVHSPTIVITPSGDAVAVRDAVTEPVRLTRVVGSDGRAAGPRCILYRTSLANNATLWGTGNALVWQPLADGVSRLELRYFDEAGEEIAAPGGDESSSEARRRIAEIEVRIVALERRPDPDWRDPKDPDPATASYRKAEMVFRVGLRNAGAVTQVDRAASPAYPP